MILKCSKQRWISCREKLVRNRNDFYGRRGWFSFLMYLETIKLIEDIRPLKTLHFPQKREIINLEFSI